MPGSALVFEEADRALGFSISELCFSGSEEALKLTENTQPAILTVSVATQRVLEEKGIRPDFVAGHSLGKHSAPATAGALSFADAVRLARRRGQYMQEAVPSGEGAMAAILGLRPGQVTEICRKAAADREVVVPANPQFSRPNGHLGACRGGEARGRAGLGQRRQARRHAGGLAPFHSELMRPSQQRLEKDLRATSFGPLQIPLGHQRGRQRYHQRG